MCLGLFRGRPVGKVELPQRGKCRRTAMGTRLSHLIKQSRSLVPKELGSVGAGRICYGPLIRAYSSSILEPPMPRGSNAPCKNVGARTL